MHVVLLIAGILAAWFALAVIIAVPIGKALKALGKADRRD